MGRNGKAKDEGRRLLMEDQHLNQLLGPVPLKRPTSPLRMMPPILAVCQRVAHSQGDSPYLAEASKSI